MNFFLDLWNNTAIQATIIAAASHVVVWLVQKIPTGNNSTLVKIKDGVLGGLADILQKGVSAAPSTPSAPTQTSTVQDYPLMPPMAKQPEPVSTANVLTEDEKKAAAHQVLQTVRTGTIIPPGQSQ